MAITLGQPKAPGLPVVQPRHLGARLAGMVVNTQVRQRQDNGEPIYKPNGKPSYEEVVTLLILDGTTATISGGDFEDDRAPEPGEICRRIYRGRPYGQLIEARNNIRGQLQVGDVIEETSPTATIWKGPGQVARAGVDNLDDINKARAKGLTVGWDLDITYRRATPQEADLVTRAEAVHMEHRQTTPLDNGSGGAAAQPGPFDDDDLGF